MKFEDYKREIELIRKQNCIEQDLYSVIACLIREQENSKSVSIRDVSNRRRTKLAQGLEKESYGIGGFPDFVVLSEEFSSEKSCRENVLGAIEAKYIGCKLDEIEKNEQLKGHILWFNKVLYTNGLWWQYYEYSASQENSISIEQLQNNLYFWRKKEAYPWRQNELQLLKSMKGLQPKWSIWLVEAENGNNDKMKWKESEWDKLQNELLKITWEKME
jgi:hypothetical protein